MRTKTVRHCTSDGKLEDNVNIESYSMPPKAPEGSFDVRLSGDYRLSESEEVSIEIQATEYPISVMITQLENGEEYEMVEIAEGVEVKSHRINDAEKIIYHE